MAPRGATQVNECLGINWRTNVAALTAITNLHVRRKKQKLTLMMIILVASLSLTSCNRVTLVSGKITDASGNPIANAIVLMRSSKIQYAMSNMHGDYSIETKHWRKTTFTIDIQKEGFFTYRVVIPDSAGGTFKRIILLKKETKVPQGDFDVY
jgi:hypothetical protein